MKNPNFGLAPTVICFGKNNLKERIISIMNFKKPTALTTALSAFLVIGTTAAFAVSPKTEDPIAVSDPEPVITTSEPVSVTDPADNNSETGEPEPIASEDKPAGEILVNDDSIWSEPDDNGFSYSKSGDAIRVPIMDVISNSDLDGKAYVFKIILDENKEKHILALRLDNLPAGYTHDTYFGYEYAILEKSDCDSLEPENYTYEEILEDGIIRGYN